VSPEASRFIAKANTLLEHATRMLAVGLSEDAGRNAYLAGFHAAQALLFDTTGKAFKSHRGVQKDFLHLKAIADYETGPGSEISPDRAALAVRAGKEFVSHIAALLSGASSRPSDRY
jgi:hypothetical protein